MAEDRIAKFCAQVDPRSISLVMTNCPPDRRGQGHATVNISKTVQDKGTLSMED